MNPVRLLLTGSGLQEATVRWEGGGARISRVTAGASGTHLFCDLEIRRGASIGPHWLTVKTSLGNARASFEVLEALPAAGRFQGFDSDDLVYLILPDRFANGDAANDAPAKSPDLLDRSKPRFYHGGDLRGVIQRLPYLKDLGVTALWLNPWYDNHDRLNEREKYNLENKLDPVGGLPITDYHGYGAVDFYAVDEHLGDLATLRELVDTAHGMGIKVVQDQVANHVGPYHPWVSDSPTPTWFHGTAAVHPENTWQTWTIPDRHATPELQHSTLDGWFINLLPDLNQGDPECARYLIQNALWWVGVTGIDGIRQDTLPYVPRTFWRDWSAALKRQHPKLGLLGEVLDGDTTKVAFYQTGAPRPDGVDSGMDSLFDFPLFYKLRDVFAEGRPIQGIAEQLARDWVYPDPMRLVTFVGLHDVDRFMSVRGADHQALRLALAMVLTTRGIPLVYYGDEIGLAGGGDPENRRDFPGGFPGDTRSAFEAGGRTPEEQATWAWVRHLARVRQASVALRRGQLLHLMVDNSVYVFARVTPDERVLVAFHTGASSRSVTIPVSGAGFRDGNTLQSLLDGPAAMVLGNSVTLELPPRSVSLLR